MVEAVPDIYHWLQTWAILSRARRVILLIIAKPIFRPICVDVEMSMTEFDDIDDLAASSEIYCTWLTAEVLPS